MQPHMPSTRSWQLCRCGHHNDMLLNNARVLSGLPSPDPDLCPLPYACSLKTASISAKAMAGLRVTAAAEKVFCSKCRAVPG